MQLELNRTTFRRLVQLYLLFFLLLVLAAAYMAFDPTWSAFDDEFNRLADRHFTPFNAGDAMMALAGAFLIAHVAAGIGLLWFQAWARFLFWISFVANCVVFILISPAYSGSSISFLFDSIGIALLGAIFLLSYAKDHGAIWFGNSDAQIERN